MKRYRFIAGAALALFIGTIGFPCCRTAASITDPLAEAARTGNFRNVIALTKGGMDVNQYDHGWTPLLWAVYYKYIPIVQYLLENGADPNLELIHPATEYQATVIALGSTPLIIASYYGSTEIVKLLVENNADPERKDHRGYRAVDYAVQFRFDEIVSILSKK